jgi:hypothetical protein
MKSLLRSLSISWRKAMPQSKCAGTSDRPGRGSGIAGAHELVDNRARQLKNRRGYCE